MTKRPAELEKPWSELLRESFDFVQAEAYSRWIAEPSKPIPSASSPLTFLTLTRFKGAMSFSRYRHARDPFRGVKNGDAGIKFFHWAGGSYARTISIYKSGVILG